MTAQDLKNSILQLAVQGKLVPQNPDDEPASELLKRIKAEKERLVKKGKIKKEKVLSEVCEENTPFEIPSKWVWLRIGDFCTVFNGDSINANVKQEKYSKRCDGWSFIATKDVGFDHIINYENGIYIPLQENTFKVAPEGSILLCMEGGSAGRKIGVLDRDVCFGNKLCCFAPITINNKYIYYYLQCPQFFSDFIGSKTGLIGGVGTAKLKNVAVPLPPLAEQQRIVAKIEELLPLVEEYGKAEERLTVLNAEFPDKLRKSILQQAIQGKLTERDPADDPASELLKRIRAEKEHLIKEGKIKKEKPLPPIMEEELPFEIPENWQWVRLGYIADMCLGKMLDKAKNKGNLYPYLRNVNVRWGSFDLSDILTMRFEENETERYSVQYGDLVVCEGGEPGRCAVWADKQSSFRIQKALHRIRFYGDINSFFVFRLFELYAYNGYFAKRFTGSTIKHLPGAVLANILVPLPPLAEQQRIVERVNELLALCDKMK